MSDQLSSAHSAKRRHCCRRTLCIAFNLILPSLFVKQRMKGLWYGLSPVLSHSIPSYEVQSNSLPMCLLHPVTLRYLVVPTHEPEFTATNQPYQSSLPLFASSSIQARPSFHQPPPPPAPAANPPNTLHSGSTTCTFFASSVMISLLIKTPSLFF